MRKSILLFVLVIGSIDSFSQSWTKISSNFDSLWTNSVKYYNHGDTIIYFGGIDGPGALSPKRFYISTDGGYNFDRDFTNLDALTMSPIQSLPINDMIIGFKNTPNSGSYSFQGLGNWTAVIPFDLGYFGEINSGTLLWGTGTGNLYTLSPDGTGLVLVANGANGINLRATYNRGNRLFLGGTGGNVIKYLDNGDFNSMQTANVPSQGVTAGISHFFEAGNNIYAVVDFVKLLKSSDNGVTWDLVTTTWDNGGNIDNLSSSYIIGTPNGNIYFLETGFGTSDNVFMSTDGGLTATKIGQGLPTNGMHIGPTIGKILTNKNKVWYQVCAANNVDFVRTDTTIAGLYLLDLNVSDISENKNLNLSIFPNPVKNILHISGVIDKTKITIVNALGIEVLHEEITSENPHVYIENINPGIYFIQNENGRKLKFVKE